MKKERRKLMHHLTQNVLRGLMNPVEIVKLY